MRNMKWLLVVSAFFVLSGAVYMNHISAESPTQMIQAQLIKEGVSISEINVKDENLRIETKSISNSNKASIEDIRTIRKIRNELRSEANGLSQIKNVDLTITGINGQKIYDGVSNDITQIPDFSSKIVGNLDSEIVKEAVYSELKKNGVIVQSVDVTDNALGGKMAAISLTANNLEVNSLIPKIEEWITSLNDVKGIGISQYELTIFDESDSSKLLYLTADLVYRDFFWWQSPVLKNETWTRTQPESQESAASEDKVQATIEEGITAEPSEENSNGIEGPQFKK
ncbi:hypothetical protein [Paenibacillus lemnae]|uniref:Uncharacterized protein n=1 Tax=Paenibacillus lemnae TaxID=1330551 RepID=A0A848M898_PAELE|nr:hypothetical protein [Paenibacillus lemnae]NMO96420.1 hypothetical protein [Paenibacillus lemnae]